MAYEVKVYSMGWGTLKGSGMEVCSVVLSVNNSIPEQQQIYMIEKNAAGKFKAGMPVQECNGLNLSKMDPATAKTIQPGELEKLFAGSTQLGQVVPVNAEYFFNTLGKYDTVPHSTKNTAGESAPQDIYRRTPKKESNGQNKKGKGRSKKGN